MRAAVYARVSTHEQQTLGLQVEAMAAYIRDRGRSITRQVEDIGSGAKDRPGREALLKAARRRELDAVVVWRLDRWGRSLPDLVTTLRELTELGVGFVSLTEALDLSTPTGRAMAGMVAVFAEFEREILRERVRAGIARAREQGRPHGRPRTAAMKADEVLRLKANCLNHSEIARRPGDRPYLGPSHPERGELTRTELKPPASSRAWTTERLRCSSTPRRWQCAPSGGCRGITATLA